MASTSLVRLTDIQMNSGCQCSNNVFIVIDNSKYHLKHIGIVLHGNIDQTLVNSLQRMFNYITCVH